MRDNIFSYGLHGGEYQIKTEYSADLIQQSDGWEHDLQHNIFQRHTQRVMNLREQGVQEALSKLGYLNPTEAELWRITLNRLCMAYRSLGGLDVAFDNELVQAERLLEKYKEKGDARGID